jgi:hypothetical protein
MVVGIARGIERRITVIWVGGHDPPMKCIDSWKSMHPAWSFNVVTDDRGWENQSVIDRIQDPSGKAECIRFEVLRDVGGFVVDADSECVRALDSLGADFLEHQAVAAYENETVRPGRIACNFLGAVPDAAVFRECVAEVSRIDPTAGPAWQLCGPDLLTRVVHARRFGRDDLMIYPAMMFNPNHFSGAAAPGHHPIFAKHYWAGVGGYNSLRRWPCQCTACRSNFSMYNAPWR